MEIAPGVYSMGQSKVFETHAFLLDDGNGLTLIDTLLDRDARLVVKQIDAIGKKVTDLKRIALTHAHPSHLGGLAELKRRSGAPVYAHKWEADIIAGERRVQATSWRPQDPLITYPYQVANNLGFGKHQPCQVDHFLHGGEQFGPLQVVHTPGHTPGHLAFYWPERRALFAGDAVVTSPKFMAGWNGLTLNFRQHHASLQKMAELEVDILGVGHGDPILTNGTERLRSLLAAWKT